MQHNIQYLFNFPKHKATKSKHSQRIQCHFPWQIDPCHCSIQVQQAFLSDLKISYEFYTKTFPSDPASNLVTFYANSETFPGLECSQCIFIEIKAKIDHSFGVPAFMVFRFNYTFLIIFFLWKIATEKLKKKYIFKGQQMFSQKWF